MNFVAGRRVHIVGVGGAGMSALAVVLQEYGCVVSGCDAGNERVLASLRDAGVDAFDHHDAHHVDEVDVVLWSPAIARHHVELVAAQAHGRVLLARREVLAELATLTRLIGITGTHGKTTATSMLVHIMAAAGRDDGRLVGAPVRGVGFGGHYGTGDLLAEVDESYGAFAELTPFAVGLLNVEADHLDHYGTLENLETAFASVLRRTVGPVVVWTDDPGAARVAAQATREVISVGTHASAWWRLAEGELTRRGARARLRGPVDIDIDLGVTGRHNLANAAVAAALAVAVGVDPRHVSDGLARFRGAPRRFEHVARWRGIDVVDDYAHLPGEIAASVRAARDAGYRRVVALFQPHRVTRTQLIGAAFAPAFDEVDALVVTDIYRAGEPNPQGLTGEVIADYVNERGLTPARYAATLTDAARALESDAAGADLVLIVGAGDVTNVLGHLSEVAPLDDGSPTTVTSRGVHEFVGADSRVIYHAPLGERTTYRVGGSVAALVTMSSEVDVAELSALVGSSAREIVVIGNGSNLLVADGEHDVVAVHLEGEFASLEVRDDDEGVLVIAGAGLDLPIAARRLAGSGIVGFEWAVGVPGTFGGAVTMNAGGHGSDMSASVTRVEVWTRGERRWLDAAALDFGYRRSALGPGDIVTRVQLRLARGEAALARERIADIVRWRRTHQPGGANAGSVFRNPEGDSAGRLIEAAGLKGARHGTARVSPKHANFILTDPAGSASDVLALMRDVRRVVGESTGVWLETEHRFIGVEEIW